MTEAAVATKPGSPTAGSASEFRMLHTMIRVLDLDRSLRFYCGLLGMRELRRKDYPDGKFTNAFVGYGTNPEHYELELTYNWGKEEAYQLGDAWGHIALGVSDIYATCDKLAKAGAKITRPPGPMKHGTTVIAFIEDPDGHKIELIERK